jgi:hypothetical protein
MKRWSGALAGAALAAAMVAPAPARAGFLEDAGWGVLTVGANVFYMPAKVVYATLGGVTGGFAYGLTGGDMGTAERLWVTSMAGTYVITPRMLQGLDAIEFAATPIGAGASGTTDVSDTTGLQEQPLGGS